MGINYLEIEERKGSIDPLVQYINLYLNEEDCEQREKLANFLKEKNAGLFAQIQFTNKHIFVDRWYTYNEEKNQYEK